MFGKNVSVGISSQELKIIDEFRGSKTRAEHVRDNAMTYNPHEVNIEPIENRKANLKTSLYPIEEYIIQHKVEESGIDFGKATKATNWHNFLRCVALLPQRHYERKPLEMHQDLQRLIDQGKIEQEIIAKIIVALIS